MGYFLKSIQSDTGAHPYSCSVGTRYHFLAGVKHEADSYIHLMSRLMHGTIPSLPYMLSLPLDKKERHLCFITLVPAQSPICNDGV